MSSSAGKVLLLPKGEYDSATQYKVLDWVLYQGRPYVAKQTTTGNAPIYEPTQANPDNYWQLLLDFPTVVDNVPTQNSNNLVKSGGVYSSVASKMEIDGSNTNSINFKKTGSGSASSTNVGVDVSKAAGTEETVTLSYTGDEWSARILEARLKTRIGDDGVNYPISGGYRYLIIDSVSATFNGSSSSVTASAHLKSDEPDAINDTNKYLSFPDNFIVAGSTNALVMGTGGAVSGRSKALGNQSVAYGDDSVAEGTGTAAVDGGHSEGNLSFAKAAHAEGYHTMASGTYSHSEGDETVASGMYSHVEGWSSKASGTAAHAEGESTTASGDNTHASGYHTTAGYMNQTVVGKYNSNKQTTLFEIGNGTNTTPSNAFEVYSDGTFSMDNGTSKFKLAKVGGVDGYYDSSNNFHSFLPYKELIETVTLSTSTDTTVTFTDSAITTTSTIETFTSVYGLNPTDVDSTTTTGVCTVTFAKANTAATIDVKIRVS